MEPLGYKPTKKVSRSMGIVFRTEGAVPEISVYCIASWSGPDFGQRPMRRCTTPSAATSSGLSVGIRPGSDRVQTPKVPKYPNL